MQGSLLAVLVVSVLLAALARRFDVSAPLLLWSAGPESSYVGLKNNLRPIGLLAVGLPLATTFAVGFVAYKTVPDLTLAAGLTLGAIVAPPDAVSATAVGRRHRHRAAAGFPHRLRPVAAQRSAGGKRRRSGPAVRHLPHRRGSTRPGCRTGRCGSTRLRCWRP